MILLAPVYDPGPRLPEFVTELHDAAPDVAVIVVDDGSSPSAEPVLQAARDLGCTVLQHAANQGKGVALKTGFQYVAQAYPDQDVVCADADGQHSIADVLRIARHVRTNRRMTLGVRSFDGKVPLRSRLGNSVTRTLFRAVARRAIDDTQTGLRGYPGNLLDWLQSVPGERYEYEMNVLLEAVRAGHAIDQIPIATTYMNGNTSSKFGSLSDSARVYRSLLRYAVAGGIG